MFSLPSPLYGYHLSPDAVLACSFLPVKDEWKNQQKSAFEDPLYPRAKKNGTRMTRMQGNADRHGFNQRESELADSLVSQVVTQTKRGSLDLIKVATF